MHFPASLSGLNVVVSIQEYFLSQSNTLPLLEGWWISFPSFTFSDRDDGSTPALFRFFSASTFSNLNSQTGRCGSIKKVIISSSFLVGFIFLSDIFLQVKSVPLYKNYMSTEYQVGI